MTLIPEMRCVHYRRDVVDTTLSDKVLQWLAPGRWFSPSTPVSSTNKTDCHDIVKKLLKVALKYYNPLTPQYQYKC
jgi:hypothetical protein